ncbi:Ribosomal RNA small subunit methyltransferase H [secondary endosymbiont of Trabutina mannipara]|uniref:Ribosomal RNA small subunit methyltransferase H n=1 Tax=secondary endosymbiont of Trabutina mannipara TaxID=1835721 RepID=A0A1C3L3T4_9ENTR|nr:16S rRNA (cytosine(1402)-N(4))-methyltransferase RsmH [secondary endosymbiont of Trabutina mannipara]SBT81931.1 Ribosomal RNA small subunit methyltransferase H [secondary endosymbiont of Trabutina mannipara]
MSKNYLHKTVFLNEAVKSLNINPDGVYLDGTFGRGGHSRLILSKINANGHLFAIDRDPTAVEIANNIKDYRFTIIHGLLSKITFHMAKWNLIGRINGILLDLGVSSPQFEDPKRGFSFKNDGLLDMRMDKNCGQSAAQWLTRASVDDITFVLKKFGDERFAKRIAKAIFLRNRHHPPITRNQELVALITNNIPFRDKHKHPARRSFQAIRIYINNELKEIKQALDGALTLLAPGGRLSVISFHSIEDRLVKQFIRQHSRIPQIIAKLPLTEQQISAQYNNNRLQLKSIGKILPSTQEINENQRSRSAVLRIAEKI